MTDVPASLRDRIVHAVEVAPLDGRIPEILRLVGERLMEQVKAAPSTHETAMKLLAADALITFACEAIAEEEPERLAELS